VKIDLFQPSDEGEARILLLIEGFSRGTKPLEGRTKLAKLDFFLRYPAFLKRALEVRQAVQAATDLPDHEPDIETKMVRYRYGPWDPAYFAILGRLLGKGLVEPIPINQGIGYRVTAHGREVAKRIAEEPIWQETSKQIRLLKQHLDLQGSSLKKFVYENFPEVTKASWGDSL
jgi:DNA-binding PadR family transcriptional regulator